MNVLLLLLTLLQPNDTIQASIKEAAQLREQNCDSALAQLNAIILDESASLQHRGERSLQIGMTHYCLGNYQEALLNYQRAAEQFRRVDGHERVSLILNLIGTLHKKQGDMDLAMEYFQEALGVAKANDIDIEIGNSLNNIGLVYFQTDQVEEALRHYLKSNEYKIAANDTLGLSYNYDNIGQVYSRLGQPDSAIYYFELASEYKTIVGEVVGGAIVKSNLGEALLSEGLVRKARPYFEQALEVAQKVGYLEFEAYTLNKMSEIYETLGDHSRALDFYKQHATLSDSLFNIQKTRALSELEKKYETEKKEQQIVIQQAEIAEQRAQNQRNLATIGGLVFVIILLGAVILLVRSRERKKQELLLQEAEILLREAQIEAAISSQEKERTRFARDLHDGFGQMISVLNLNLRTLEKEGANSHQVFEQSAKVLEEMYQELKGICFNLMPQTLIKSGIAAAVNEFASRIGQTGKLMVQTDFFGLEDRLSEVQEISLYRITQEWINNLLKYSDADRVNIQITKDEQEITLLIEDNGSGFNLNLLKAGKGNGWRNMNSRANLMKGELEVDTTPGIKGNTLIVNAPVFQVEESLEKMFNT